MNGVIVQGEYHAGWTESQILLLTCEQSSQEQQSVGSISTMETRMCASWILLHQSSGVKQRKHSQKGVSWRESRPTLCKCFLQPSSALFLIHTLCYRCPFHLLQGFFECYVTEMCSLLRNAWTEMFPLWSEGQHAALQVTEIPRIFLHSCDVWLMAATPSLCNFNYANHCWKPSHSHTLVHQHCNFTRGELWYKMLWKDFRKQ